MKPAIEGESGLMLKFVHPVCLRSFAQRVVDSRVSCFLTSSSLRLLSMFTH